MRLLVLLFMLSISSVSAQQLIFKNKSFKYEGRSYKMDEFRRYLYQTKHDEHMLIADFESFAEAQDSGNGWKVMAVTGAVGTGLFLMAFSSARSSDNIVDKAAGGIASSAGLLVTIPLALVGTIGYQNVKGKRKRKLDRFLYHFNSGLSMNEQHEINLNISSNGLGVAYSF